MNTRDFLEIIRFKNTTAAVSYTLLFSFLIARKTDPILFLLLLCANLLAVWSIYSFNDLEDAKLEMRTRKRKFFHKNLILEGKISKQQALLIVLISSFLALSISIIISFLNFYLIVTILFIGLLYSSSRIKLKSKPPIDILLHALVGPLIVFSIFVGETVTMLYLLTLVTFFLGSLVPEIVNQRYDLHADRRSGIKTTALALGRELSLNIVMILSLAIIILNGIIFFFYGGKTLALIYFSLSPLSLVLLTKRARNVLEKKPIILFIPVFINLLMLVLGS